MPRPKKTNIVVEETPIPTPPKKSKMYFNSDTEAAIIEYNKCSDHFERELIFRKRIHPALDKLAENVINRFKFPYIDESFDDIKAQVVSFLVLNLHKFTEDKGKAFSYFSVVAKNYLILHNNNAYKEGLRSTYLNDSANDESFALEERLSTSPEEENAKSDARDFVQLLIQYWDFNLTKIFKKPKDRDIANAVVELLRRSNSIENFNKKALYLLIREMTNHKTVHITKVINKMKVHVLEQMKEYRKTGHLSDPSMFFSYKSDE
jgi:hypothetical protein